MIMIIDFDLSYSNVNLTMEINYSYSKHTKKCFCQHWMQNIYKIGEDYLFGSVLNILPFS